MSDTIIYKKAWGTLLLLGVLNCPPVLSQKGRRPQSPVSGDIGSVLV